MSKIVLTLFLIWTVILTSETESSFSISGPGLKPHSIVLPCRYFHIKGSTANESPPEPNLNVSITGTLQDSHREIPIRSELFDRLDGSFLVRYKTFSSFEHIRIEVTSDGEHVEGSPLSVEGPIFSSSCDCPEPDFDRWFADLECPTNVKQIEDDLNLFPEIDIDHALAEAVKRFGEPRQHSFCHYAVLDNAVHRRCYGEYVGFNMFVDAILLYLTRVVQLPNVEFLINLGDWPLIKKNKKAFPMISWCKTDDHADVLLPTYEITESSLECMGRQTLDMLSVQGKIKEKWDEKDPKAFWRGRDSRRERLALVKLAKANPDLIDASITKYFFFKDEEKKLGSSEYTPFFDFFKYKYQLNIDGTVAAYRLPFLLAGNSMVLKQDSPYKEHFYNELHPHEHFVPVKNDLSDVIDKIRWARDNDSKAKEFAENARVFANNYLLPKEIFCYHALLFSKWSSRLSRKVRLHEGMEIVPQAEDKRFPKCKCDKKNERRKDEL